MIKGSETQSAIQNEWLMMFPQVVLTSTTFEHDIVQRKEINLNYFHDAWQSVKLKRTERIEQLLSRVGTCQVISTQVQLAQDQRITLEKPTRHKPSERIFCESQNFKIINIIEPWEVTR